MQKYVHAVISSTLAWAGSVYDLVLLTYTYPFLHEFLGLSYLDLTVLFSLGLIGRVIGASVFGGIADSKGRKPVALIGSPGYALFQTLFAFSTFYPMMLAFRTIEGVFMGAQWTSWTVLAIEQAPREKPRFVNSVVQAGYAMGYALIGVTYMLLGGQLSSLAGYREFMLTGSLPPILVPYIYFKVTEDFRPVERAKGKVRDYSPYFIRASLAMSGVFVAYLSIFSIYPDFARPSGFPIYYVGLLTAMANLIQGGFLRGLRQAILYGGHVQADLLGNSRAVVCSLLGNADFLPAQGNYDHEPRGLPLRLLRGLLALISAITTSSVPSEVRAFITGTAYNVSTVADWVVSALIGEAIEAFGMGSLPYFMDVINFASLTVVFISVFTRPSEGCLLVHDLNFSNLLR